MDPQTIKNLLIKIGLAVNARCREVLDTSGLKLNQEVKISPADIIYRIDIEAEHEITAILHKEARDIGGVELIAEGIGEDDVSIYPEDSKTQSLKIICDPIDGSRGLMYSKRPAFFLAAAGPASAKSLNEMTVSVMVELPIPKQNEFDVLWAVEGEGAFCERYDSSGKIRDIELKVSQENSVEGGFMSFAKFCYPGKDLIGRIEEKFLDHLFENRKEHYLPVFDDQYISTGGQLYELICGHDRFTADIRASMYSKFKSEGKKQGQVCHPYDMAGLLVAKEAGVIVEDVEGNPFDCPLVSDINIDWIAYANSSIRNQCKGPLKNLLIEEGLI